MNKTLSNIIIGISALLIVGAVGRYTYTEYPWLFSAVPENDVATKAVTYPGSLIMALQPSLPANSVAGLYEISAHTNALKKVNDSHDFFTPSVSPDGLTTVTAVAMDDGTTQLVLSSTANGADEVRITPPSPTLFAGHSVWSPDGAYIVYEALTAKQSQNDPDINMSRIILFNRATNEQVIIDTGSSPVFLPDNSVLYLKSDGVYHAEYGLTPSSAPQRVAYFDNMVIGRAERIAVSHTGDTIAFSNPDAGELTLSRLLSDDDGQRMAGAVVLKGLYFWPTFSPDDSRVAAVEYYKDTDGAPHKSLAMFNVTTREGSGVVSLDAYSDDHLSIGAWLK